MAEQLQHRGSAGASGADSVTGVPNRDWPAEVADTIVRVVDQVKGKTTKPAMTAVRGLVYGLIGAMLGLPLLVLTFVGLFRAVDRLRNLVVEDAVWLTYLVLGIIFTLAGLAIFATRKPRSQEPAQ
jgi:hypothetical protein